MAGGVGKVFKTCIERGECADESCDHPWYLEYWRFNKRYRRSIASLYRVAVKSKREAEKVWLPKFVNEINEALENKRVPFKDHLDKLRGVSNVLAMSFTDFLHTVYMPEYYETTLDDPAFKKRHSTTFYMLHQLLDRFGEIRLPDFNDALVKGYKHALKTERSKSGEPLQPASYNRMLSKLRQIMHWGYTHERQYFARVPFGGAGVKLDLTLERSRERRLLQDPDEEAMLIEAARLMNAPEHDFVGEMMELRIVAAIDLCARRGELMRIKRRDIDYKAETVTLPRFALDHRGEEVRGTKNGESRILTISDRLMARLASRKALPPDAFVFGKADGSALAPHSLAKPFNTLKLIAYGYTPGWMKRIGADGKDKTGGWFDAVSRERLEQINLHWHDFRHEGASRWGESGKFTPKGLMEFLGHKELETTMRYWQLSDVTQRDAVKAASRAYEAERVAREKEKRQHKLRLV